MLLSDEEEATKKARFWSTLSYEQCGGRYWKRTAASFGGTQSTEKRNI